MSESLVNYEAVEALLAEYPVEQTPAMLHGTLCGWLCTGRPVAFMDWWQQLQLDLPTPIHPAPEFETFFHATATALADSELAFTPLLPDDNAPLAERTQALGEWCQSWLYGLTLAGGERQNSLTGSAAEAVQDLSLIAQLETPTDPTEAEEFAYESVLEYVRIAVLLVREEFLGASQDEAPISVMH
jgi:uncharacterized protein